MDAIRYKDNSKMTYDEAIKWLQETKMELERIEQKERNELLNSVVMLDGPEMTLDEWITRCTERIEKERCVQENKDYLKQQCIKSIEEVIRYHSADVFFTYHDEFSGISISEEEKFLLWWGYHKKEFDTFIEMMDEKFFGGKTLNELIGHVIFEPVKKGDYYDR